MVSDFMSLEHVTGKDKGKIMLYALSTCIWCKKTKEFLSSVGVAYDYIYVDLLKGEERLWELSKDYLRHETSLKTR